jgi:rSAM/selenodomain-associated transferase 1
MSETALVILARAPQEGTGKTRLAATLGTRATLQLYQAFLTDLARRFAGQPYALHWAYTPVEADFRAMLARLVPGLLVGEVFPQAGSDLNSRLHHAFYTTHARAFRKTILIGSDAPHVSCATIARAEQALDQADVILGPAEDGGYYLIAMHTPSDLFSQIPMSTSKVLSMTIQRAHDLGLSVCQLEPLVDVDDWPSLTRLRDLLQTTPDLAPATAACLAELACL